jgi:hypothetical protein
MQSKKLGLSDMYNSTRTFINERMTPVTQSKAHSMIGKKTEVYGWMKRAGYLPGRLYSGQIFIG